MMTTMTTFSKGGVGVKGELDKMEVKGLYLEYLKVKFSLYLNSAM